MQRVPRDRAGGSSRAEGSDRRRVGVFIRRLFELDRVARLIGGRGQGEPEKRCVCYIQPTSVRAHGLILERLTLTTYGTEPSLGLSLPPLPRRRPQRRRRRHRFCNAITRNCNARPVRGSTSSRRRFLPARDLATCAKLDHPERTFTTDDQVATGEQDDVSRVG